MTPDLGPGNVGDADHKIRPPHVTADRNRCVPALDNAHGLFASGTIRGGLAYGGGYVEVSGADAHQATVARMIDRREGRSGGGSAMAPSVPPSIRHDRTRNPCMVASTDG
jgi:hypothetical protein